MYPLKFENLYYEKIWGGRALEKFRDNLCEGRIGESWDVACHPNGTSIVSNGKFKGIRLDKLIELKGSKLIGTKISSEWFPLLVKLITASEKLSIQVHPDDKYAKMFENQMGKTEVWYVLGAYDGASLIIGTKENCTKEIIKRAALEGNLEKYMNKIAVKKDEIYLIKSGLVHAICEGVVIVEIQQNSDVTYRVYDYNRGRELHIDKAVEVINLDIKSEKVKGVKVEKDGYSKIFLCSVKEFSLELYEIEKSVTEESDEERFYIFTCVDGQGKIIYERGEEHLKVGDSILIPATLGKYTLQGRMKVLKSFVPDINNL